MRTQRTAETRRTGSRLFSGADGSRTHDLRIANVMVAHQSLNPTRSVHPVVIALLVAILATLTIGVNPKTVASCMRRSERMRTEVYEAVLGSNRWHNQTARPVSEDMPMSAPLPSPGVPSLDELRTLLAKLYRNERSPKSAWRVDHVLKQVQRLGVTHLGQITRETLSDWRASVAHLAPRTQKGYYSALCTALNFAVESGWIARSPASIMPMRFSTRRLERKRHLEWGELERLFAGLLRESTEGWEQHRLFALTVTIFSTGMRAGEAQRLRVAEIDLPRGIIDLRSRDLKTDASSALVAMPDVACDVLARWLPECGSEWAFPHAHRTGPWLHGAPGKKPLDRLQQAAARAGVPHVTFAMGRHGFVTHGLTRFGLTAEQVAAQTRHTNLKTQGHYAHFDAANQRAIVARIELPGLAPPVAKPERSTG